LLARIDGLPQGLLGLEPHELDEWLDGPTLIHLDGDADAAVFVCVLQHGNEDTGWRAVQRLLSAHVGRPLPRPMWLFIANPRAARHGLRTVAGRPDLNRCWPGTELAGYPEIEALAQVVDTVSAMPLFASVDLHNTTGESPPHVGLNRLSPPFLRLARMYARLAIHFERPLGAQSQAFAALCPAVTLECGRAGNPGAIEHTRAFLDRLLQLDDLANEPPAGADLALYQSVARAFVHPWARLAFASEGDADLHLEPAVDRLNFRELAPGTALAVCPTGLCPIHALDPSGNDVTASYFELDQGALRLRRRVMPTLLSPDARVVREDCLCQLTEPLIGIVGA